MLKKQLTKFASVLLLSSLVVSLISPAVSVSAADDPIHLDIEQAQVIGEYSVDLTQAGNVDWLHVKGSGLSNLSHIKKTDSTAISFSHIGTDADMGFEGKQDRGGDANYFSYSWTDGMTGYETGSNDTGFGVFFPTNRDAGTYDNVGWTFTIEPQAQESTVFFGIGMWQAKVDVNFYTNNTLVDTKKVSAGGNSEVYRYQVTVPANTTLKVEGIQTESSSNYGNMSFSGVAVSSTETVVIPELPELDIVQGQVNGEFSLDLSQVGNVDWLHLKGSGINNLIHIKKAGSNAINFYHNGNAAQMGYEGKMDRGTDINYLSYSWTDGMAGYETGVRDTGFGIFFPSNRNAGVYDNVGWTFEIEPQALDTTVVFGLGMWQAKVDVKIYANDQLVETKKISAGGTSEIYKYQIKVPANAKLKVQGVQTESISSHGNMTFSGLAVSSEEVVDKLALFNEYNKVKEMIQNFYTENSWAEFVIARNEVKAMLDKVDATQTEVDQAIANLHAALDALTYDATNLEEHLQKISGAVIKGYTASSVNDLKDAIAAVEQLDDEATEQERQAALSDVMKALEGLVVSGRYKYETHANMTAAFGFEGDKNASLGFLDGSYQIGGTRSGQFGPVAPKQMVTFGITDTSNIKWYNKEGYLPVFVSEYTKDNVSYIIETFGNKHTVDDKDYVLNYSRVTATNNSSERRLLPRVSNNLIPLNVYTSHAYTIEPGETVVRDYAIEADKYEYFDRSVTSYTTLTREQVAEQGTYEDNYNAMKNYWNTRLAEMIDIELPNPELVNAFKAGYIYTMIIKDKTYLHVGENGYAGLWSHDTLGILIQLIQSGDFMYAKDYLESVPLVDGINIETGGTDGSGYWDTNWKLSWAYAVYLSKTGDASIFDEEMTADDGSVGTIFEKRVKVGAKSIETDRTHEGIMKETYAIDSHGYWTIDNYSALMGLTAYEYITRELYRIHEDEYYLQEAEWAKALYEDLLEKFTAKLQQTITNNGLDYIPTSVIQSNDDNRTRDSRDANWASMFLFGRWTWDGFLYGANQPDDNINLSMLDDTYTYGINRRVQEGTTDSIYNFGGYPHGFYSSSYNAGYGSAALRGELYRDMGIKANEFMIERSMSGPFSWWEGINYPSVNSPWAKTNDNLNIANTPGGGGSAQHIWGQSVNSKVLIDSLIAERIYDQNEKVEFIIGRGIPKEWVSNAASNNNVVAKVQNYPVLQGGRIGYEITRSGNTLVVALNANTEQAKIAPELVQFSIQLPSMVGAIGAVSTGTFDNDKGIVNVPLGTQQVTITLSNLPAPSAIEQDKAELTIGYAQGDNYEAVKQSITLPTTGEHGSRIAWFSSNPNVISNDGKVVRPTATTNVTLIAMLTKEDEVAYKEFIVTVVAKEITPPSSGGGSGNGGGGDDGSNGNDDSDSGDGSGTDGSDGSTGADDQEGSSGNGETQPKLTDITGHWARESIEKAIERKIVVGFGDGTFRPNGLVTRSEFTVMLGRALSFPLDVTTASFNDADSIPTWAQDYVAYAAQKRFVTGYTDGTFRPQGQVNRLELIVMLVRALQLPVEPDASIPFTDAELIPAWGKSYVAAAYKAGLINGNGNNAFAPSDQATRAEAVTMLVRALEQLESQSR